MRNDILKTLYVLFYGRGRVVDAFESKIFPIKMEGTDILDKILDHSGSTASKITNSSGTSKSS